MAGTLLGPGSLESETNQSRLSQCRRDPATFPTGLPDSLPPSQASYVTLPLAPLFSSALLDTEPFVPHFLPLPAELSGDINWVLLPRFIFGCRTGGLNLVPHSCST